jgi:hypothetical protein
MAIQFLELHIGCKVLNLQACTASILVANSLAVSVLGLILSGEGGNGKRQ